MKTKNDTLFDGNFTWLDGMKIALLVLTMFSTWSIVDLVTPDVPLAFVRELAALIIVEGAFLAFEYATSTAKSKKQVEYATKGFFASLIVIVSFALLSGALEFGGDALLLQSANEFMGLEMLARDWVMVCVVVVVAAWVGVLGTLFRLYSLADPDKKAELEMIAIQETVTTEANKAMETALEKARPVIAMRRAVANVRATYKDDMKPDELEHMVRDVEDHLSVHYQLSTPAPALFQKKESIFPSPLEGTDGDNL